MTGKSKINIVTNIRIFNRIKLRIFRKMTNKNKKSSAGIGGIGCPAAPSKQASQQSKDSQDYSSFKTVLFYCMLTVCLPVVTFFLLRVVVLDGFFEMSKLKVDIFSSVGAVVSLHMALGLYIYRATCEVPGLKASKLD
ncbi:vacuolar ATPase assembly integral membrane protein VMA21 homolog [Drosophila pseudoobscura]|uniref:Vacuolar ATPase assembly integral membrane protein VMA21 homolog n=1 Tax=Drosophila pseudoobscura pseudoobscura TaxID=46245 RepID=A0A6I8UZY7_DROPS|nr:vacuolar ATPase assembly integral membrane protein VMA21 homolog [Drosophila pseudoobscura]